MTYVTKSGDMWDSIAKSELGSEKYMDKLIQANEQYSNIVVFSAGIKLDIPAIAKPLPTYIPPWRQ